MNPAHENSLVKRTGLPIWIASVAAPAALWFSQPPIGFWPLAFVAIIPWIQLGMQLASDPEAGTKRDYAVIWLASAVYWLVSLQGLRLAHPLMFIPWGLFGFYLAAYHVLFVALIRSGCGRGIPMIVVAPITWVGLECIRNYLFTGISVLMLGHHVADVPALIQIADIFGTYGVSFLVAMINVALWMLCIDLWQKQASKPMLATCAIAGAATVAAVLYGLHRIAEPTDANLATFALIQRSEPIEYEHSEDHERQIFANYLKQSVQAAANCEEKIDAVVWPESMFTGAEPWRIADANAVVPEGFEGSKYEFRELVRNLQSYFVERARYVQTAIAMASPSRTNPLQRPQILAGCAVIRYRDQPEAYSGFVNIASDGTLTDWYGKTHLVMFGEYIPIAPSIPGLRSLIPLGLGVTPGPGAKRFGVGDTVVAPNICIETAVERVALNQLASYADDSIPDVIVTVTNDGWFDDSSVIDHHLTCARLLAVGCRRPILSSANSGPTAWIDSRGKVVQRLETGTHGSLIATPKRDARISTYLRIGDWPARMCVLAMIGMRFFPKRKSR